MLLGGQLRAEALREALPHHVKIQPHHVKTCEFGKDCSFIGVYDDVGVEVPRLAPSKFTDERTSAPPPSPNFLEGSEDTTTTTAATLGRTNTPTYPALDSPCNSPNCLGFSEDPPCFPRERNSDSSPRAASASQRSVSALLPHNSGLSLANWLSPLTDVTSLDLEQPVQDDAAKQQTSSAGVLAPVTVGDLRYEPWAEVDEDSRFPMRNSMRARTLPSRPPVIEDPFAAGCRGAPWRAVDSNCGSFCRELLRRSFSEHPEDDLAVVSPFSTCNSLDHFQELLQPPARCGFDLSCAEGVHHMHEGGMPIGNLPADVSARECFDASEAGREKGPSAGALDGLSGSISLAPRAARARTRSPVDRRTGLLQWPKQVRFNDARNFARRQQRKSAVEFDRRGLLDEEEPHSGNLRHQADLPGDCGGAGAAVERFEMSMGALHAKGKCKPCAFFHSKSKVCRHGDSCAFCHHGDHAGFSVKQWKKQQQRLRQSGDGS
eukprot:Polyplicarium_translucidae@DN3389_c0_g1_i4.p1